MSSDKTLHRETLNQWNDLVLECEMGSDDTDTDSHQEILSCDNSVRYFITHIFHVSSQMMFVLELHILPSEYITFDFTDSTRFTT